MPSLIQVRLQLTRPVCNPTPSIPTAAHPHPCFTPTPTPLAAMIDETTGGLVFELKKMGELGEGQAFTVRLEVRCSSACLRF